MQSRVVLELCVHYKSDENDNYYIIPFIDINDFKEKIRFWISDCVYSEGRLKRDGLVILNFYGNYENCLKQISNDNVDFH